MELRDHLPAGAGLVPLVFWPLFGAFATYASLLVAYVVAASRGRGASTWTEAARRAYPVRVVHTATLLLPAVATTLAISGLGPASLAPSRLVGVLTFLASYLSGLALSGRMERRVLGLTRPVAGWWRRVAAAWLVRLPNLVVAGVIALFMPPALGAGAAAVFALGALGLYRCSQGDGVRLAGALGLLQRSARLDGIAGDVAQRMGAPAPRTWLIPSLHHEALAVPSAHTVLFSDRALRELDDAELAAICAHETGHLMEPARVVAQRSAAFVFLLPIAGARPLIGSLGAGPYAFFVLLLLAFGLAQRGWSRRLEQKADAAAAAHQSDAGQYARALLKVYQANLIPAVSPGKGGTHPHLYDRLVAAGEPPDWPRPAPPPKARGLIGLCAGSALAVFLLSAPRLLRAPEDPQGRRAALLITLTGGSAAEISDLALARFRESRFDEAADLYRAAAALEPRRSRHRANLALVLARLGRCDEWEAVAATLPPATARAAPCAR